MKFKNFLRRGQLAENVVLAENVPGSEELAIIEITKMQAFMHELEPGSDGLFKRTPEKTTDGKYQLYSRIV